MPLPKPNAGEKQDAFISRCMSSEVIQREFPKREQRLGACFAQYRKKTLKDGDTAPDFFNDLDRVDLKLETVNMDGVEILDMGMWKGIEFDEARYDRIIDNFKKGIIEPYVTLDHDIGVTDSMKKILKAVSLGFVSDLKKVGTKLVASFKQVPKAIADMIQAGPLKKRSVEYWKKFQHADGNIYSDVLEAVTFHGANGAPAIHTLSDFVNLYKDELQSVEHDGNAGSCETINFNEGGKEMTDEEKKEMEALRKFKQDHPVDDQEKVKLKADAEAKDKKLAEQDKKIKAADKFKADRIEDDKATLKAEAETYVKKLIDDHKLLPKFKDRNVEEYIRLKSDATEGAEDRFKLFTDEVESRDKIINFGDFKDDGKGKGTGQKVDMKHIDTVDEEHPVKPFDDIEEAIQTQMKRDGSSYEEAAVKVGAMTPAEAGIEKEGK